MLKIYSRIPENILCCCRRTFGLWKTSQSRSVSTTSFVGRRPTSSLRNDSYANSRCRYFESVPNALRHPGHRLQSCRGVRTSVQCSANPPKTVHDIVRRVTKGDVTVTFARSGGAGGQNVNKVNTKVDMRLNVAAASWLSEDLKDALHRLEKKRINKEGELVVTSTLTRSQADNVEDALQKMQACIDNAAESLIPAEVDPEKMKQIAKQKKIANENRLDEKKKKAMKKTDRRAKIEW